MYYKIINIQLHIHIQPDVLGEEWKKFRDKQEMDDHTAEIKIQVQQDYENVYYSIESYNLEANKEVNVFRLNSDVMLWNRGEMKFTILPLNDS